MMSTSPSAEHDLVMSFLGYDWVDMNELVEMASPKVHPGRAIRKYQVSYRLGVEARKGKGAPLESPLDQDAQVRSGARTLIRSSVSSSIGTRKIAVQEVGGRKLVRRNYFTADEVDAIVASRVSDAILPGPALQEVPPPPPSVPFDDMMFDQRTVQTIIIKADPPKGQVSFTVVGFAQGRDLNLFFTAVAADWVSDQLGFQALAARRNVENPRKAFSVVKRS